MVNEHFHKTAFTISLFQDTDRPRGRQQVPGTLRGAISARMVGNGHSEAGWTQSDPSVQGGGKGETFLHGISHIYSFT